MKTLSIAILLSCLLFSSCVDLDPNSSYDRLANSITFKVAKQLKREKGVSIIGFGGGLTKDQDRTLYMAFCIYHEVSLPEARELMVYMTERYLEALDKEKRIWPFFHRNPPNIENLEIVVHVDEPSGYPVSGGKINCISERRGSIEYRSEKRPGDTFWHVDHKETYEEAKQLVDKTKQDSG